MDQAILHKLLDRPLTAHKYDFGHVLVLGGSPGMVGAPLLAGEAALRVGAGLVTIASAPNVTDKLERRVKEIMTLALPVGADDAVRTLASFVEMRKVSAVVVGPGLKPDEALATGLLRRVRRPVVLDAGGLVVFRGRLSLLREIAEAGSGMILTPHTGEYEKLTDVPLPAGKANVRQAVADFAKDHGVVLVLKGDHSLVAGPDGAVAENTTGNPGLATAGTGDVLSGVIGGLLAQGVAAMEAARAGVYLHGLAGDLAAAAKTQAGMIASDVVEFLPAALKSLA